jgi:hypothetical protein
MSRFNRINIDGRAETENRPMGEDALPGSLVYIGSGDTFLFASTSIPEGIQLYALGADTLQGKRVTDYVTAGNIGIGNYFETGRSFAMRIAAGTTLISDAPLAIGNNGLIVGASGEDRIIAYAKENYTVSDSEAELVIVRAA